MRDDIKSNRGFTMTGSSVDQPNQTGDDWKDEIIEERGHGHPLLFSRALCEVGFAQRESKRRMDE